MRATGLVTALCLSIAAGCGSPASDTAPAPQAETRTPPAVRTLPVPSAPIVLDKSAYETACDVECTDSTPENWSDLHNVFHLSENVVSGSEPLSEDALRRISEMGVKTLLSVDGATPDAETAAKYGMRYVHVPIQYKGITQDEIAKITKTFRELEGPFYVHCFHGKHRGPAAAALGRIALDGATREEAIAEMRMCGTSKSYEGLYRDVATAPVPAAEQTAAIAFDFPPAHLFQGMRGAMAEMARHWDNVVLLAGRDWAPDPDHPDMDALNESQKLHDLFTAVMKDPGFAAEPEDLRGWMTESLRQAKQIADGVRSLRQGDTSASGAARAAVTELGNSCSTCHKSYRN